ncbi:MAG: hypothetical protein A2W01_03405 [Candidatus Solincola sediminis]|uniref:DUF4352 domain-containing protein n=1 Tax=Candidatus Solincola sediminis TaxID=1797199 RepID=A0A1F2WIR9_9ACTN|nr:MAG: hypothetical protein A2Y75_08060 [Candidatus Solincola sediminis]OFW59757.1 MAG: hypothetical protein A2W01_03405 [Candidatus Solincola sediminis]
MFSGRMFVALLLPLVLIFGCLYLVTTGVDHNDVRVAGALVSADQADATIKSCAIIQDKGTRKLLLGLDISNGGKNDLALNAQELKIVLSRKDRPLGNKAQAGIFQPLSSSSYCGAAPGSQSIVPPNSTRSYTLYYWAETLPEGSEWDDYFLMLECYSTQSSFLLSKQLDPENK